MSPAERRLGNPRRAADARCLCAAFRLRSRGYVASGDQVPPVPANSQASGCVLLKREKRFSSRSRFGCGRAGGTGRIPNACIADAASTSSGPSSPGAPRGWVDAARAAALACAAWLGTVARRGGLWNWLLAPFASQTARPLRTLCVA